MLRIAICDDETDARDALRFQLEKILIEDAEEIVYEFSSGTNAASRLANHPGEIDLLFLDVEMKGLNGMETAEKIRTFDEQILIVFVTGYSDYVFDGYLVGALDYLMKLMKDRGAEDVKLCALLDKPDRRVVDVRADYTGFPIPDEFVVGYGLDYAQKYRNLPYIGIVKV